MFIISHDRWELWGTNRIRNLLSSTHPIVSDPGWQPRIPEAEQDFSVILVPVFHAVSSIFFVLPCGPYILPCGPYVFSSSIGLLIPVAIPDLPLPRNGMPSFLWGNSGNYQKARSQRNSEEGPGAHFTFQGCQWGLGMLLNSGMREALRPHPFSEPACSQGDLWYSQGLPEFPLLPIGLSQEMASSFNLLLNSTLFGRKSLTFVVCVWYPFQSKHPAPSSHSTLPLWLLYFDQKVLFWLGVGCVSLCHHHSGIVSFCFIRV